MSKKIVFAIICLLSTLMLVGCVEDDVPEDQYYTVSFETNSDTDLASISVLPDAKIQEPQITREGYQFLGWYSDSL